MAPVPESRVRLANHAAINGEGDYVLYWMISARRRYANFGLQRAVEHARKLGRPLLVLEGLRCGYRWASDRLHTFVLQGMQDNVTAFAGAGVTYYPYVEPTPGAGSGMLEALAKNACCVVTDDFPCFFLPRMVAAVAARLDVALEVVDGNGLLPMRAVDKVYLRAVDFRRALQKTLPAHLGDFPVGDALRGYALGAARLPKDIESKWPRATPSMLAADLAALSALPIDHEVAPVAVRGGAKEAGRRLKELLSDRLGSYGDRSHPDSDSASGLSPYLHFGHISPHQVFAAIAKQEEWSVDRVSETHRGQRGWLGMSEPAEGFLDQLITWRELGFNFTSRRDDYDDFDALPDWARESLERHELDERPFLYSIDEFAESKTHDELWNAAQRQLRETGVMQNYLRMLWGKKVLHWSRSPREAVAILIELNNRYALDGRNPNSYSGIFWVFGRYDRPWGPRREIFGAIRYMTSDSTLRKLRLKKYLAKWGA
ncbi:MAG: deoxyribodipyrimidine photo-lyase [Planctomycetota bacterium]|jgi:deoxyribodipyrimidine photo-lyase